MTLIVGLTGGIGCGKTSAARIFQAFGADVVDTDAISHELTAPRGAAIEAIRQAFGQRYITADDALNRASMRTLAFSSKDARRTLEAILHPLIKIEVIRRTAGLHGPYGIIVVPLLFEAGGYLDVVQRVLVVDCSQDVQLARTMARTGMEEQAVRAIMAAQLSREERLLRADDVIVNDLDVDHLERQVEALHGKYLHLSCTGQGGPKA